MHRDDASTARMRYLAQRRFARSRRSVKQNDAVDPHQAVVYTAIGKQHRGRRVLQQALLELRIVVCEIFPQALERSAWQ